MTSFILYLLGGILVVGGIALVFFRTPLREILPGGIAVAAFLIIVGLLVIGLSARAPREPVRRVDEGEGGDTTVVNK